MTEEKLPRKTETWKAVVAGFVGNVVEFMDFSIYGLAAPYIAANFFPKGDPTFALIEAYAMFAIGFLIRPIGAAYLGPLGDRIGRNKVLALSIILMGVSTGAIGVLPNYESIGIWAPVLLFACRLAQGFAAGGEWGTAASFIYEYAPNEKKGWYGGVGRFGCGLGWFVGSLVMAITASVILPESMNAWGWRIPFIVGLIVSGIGLYIRMQIDETPSYKKAKANNEISQTPLRDAFIMCKKAMFVMFLICFFFNITYYGFFVYMPTYLRTVAGVDPSVAMTTNSIASLCYTVSLLLLGYLSDKYSKKAIMIVGAVVFIIITVPLFTMLLNNSSSFGILLAVQMIFGFFTAFVGAPTGSVFTEMFPVKVRNTAVSIVYTVNVSIFGGTCPLLMVWLINETGMTLIPAVYVIVSAVVGMIGVFMLKVNKKTQFLYVEEATNPQAD